MIRTACIAASLLSGVLLPVQSAGATVTLGGRINQIVNALHESAHFAPSSFTFSISRGGGTQTLFSGIEGVRAFNDLATLNDWANGAGSSPFDGGGYKFTHSALGSFFGSQPESDPGPSFGGAPYKFTHSVLTSYFDPPAHTAMALSMAVETGDAPGTARSFASFGAPIPEPESWAMLIAGFALVGGMLRRRRPAVRPA